GRDTASAPPQRGWLRVGGGGPRVRARRRPAPPPGPGLGLVPAGWPRLPPGGPRATGLPAATARFTSPIRAAGLSPSRGDFPCSRRAAGRQSRTPPFAAGGGEARPAAPPSARAR